MKSCNYEKFINKPLIDCCKFIYNNDSKQCDYYFSIVLKIPYVFKNKKLRNVNRYKFNYLKITDVINNEEKYKHCFVTDIYWSNDCSTYIHAELILEDDLLSFIINYKKNLDDDVVFLNIFSNEQFSLQYIINNEHLFKNARVIKEIEITNDMKIKNIKFWYNY